MHLSPLRHPGLKARRGRRSRFYSPTELRGRSLASLEPMAGRCDGGPLTQRRELVTREPSCPVAGLRRQRRLARRAAVHAGSGGPGASPGAVLGAREAARGGGQSAPAVPSCSLRAGWVPLLPRAMCAPGCGKSRLGWAACSSVGVRGRRRHCPPCYTDTYLHFLSQILCSIYMIYSC
ncbi:uncharacterized protein GJ701_003231 isoform 2-T7 [Geothlypis trichas]